MPRNSVAWIAMCLSAIAGTFAAQAASKYTDGPVETAVAVSSVLDESNSAATVALSRDVASFSESVQN